jgi:hypothetical protein
MSIFNRNRFKKLYKEKKRIMTQSRLKKAQTITTSVLMTMYVLSLTSSAATFSMPQGVYDIITFVATGAAILGGVLAFYGGVRLGIAFKDNDATGKTEATNTLIGGGIIFAISTAAASGMLFEVSGAGGSGGGGTT